MGTVGDEGRVLLMRPPHPTPQHNTGARTHKTERAATRALAAPDTSMLSLLPSGDPDDLSLPSVSCRGLAIT